MLVEITPLWDKLCQARKSQQALVLATLVNTQGSSYKKAGAMLLIDNKGQTTGLISGGCLEADVAEHAHDVFDTGVAKTLHYDLSEDQLDLGVGCEGQITLLLQKLSGTYEPLSLLNPHQPQAAKLWLNTDPTLTTVGKFIYESNISKVSNMDAKIQAHVLAKQTALEFSPPPQVTICGLGTDTQPLVQLMRSLYWHVLGVDHRPAKRSQAEISTMATNEWCQNPTACDAVVIMSHNFEKDADYLAAAHEANINYIGLLGPSNRRDKVLQQAGLEHQQLAKILHAPIGLDLGGRLPENIAVSIVAEIQKHLFKP